MPKCIIPGCKITCWNELVKSHKKIALFRFPRDPKTCNEWIAKCGDFPNVKVPRVCSMHFPESDFERDLRNELLNEPLRLILKKGSVPSINLHNETGTENSGKNLSMKRKLTDDKIDDDRNVKKKCSYNGNDSDDQNPRENSDTNTKKEASVGKSKCEDLSAHSKNNSDKNTKKEISAVITKKKIRRRKQKCPDVPYVSTENKSNNVELLNRMDKLQSENWELKLIMETQRTSIREYQKKIHCVKVENNYYKKKNRKAHNCSCTIYKNAAEKMFSKGQLNLILDKRTVTRWAEGDFMKAFQLRYLCRSSYNSVKEILQYPLPGLYTLRTWVMKIPMREGLLTSFLKFLQVAGANMPQKEKLSILQFDEMQVKETHEYDSKFKQFIGPHLRMLIINIASLVGKWKQPIYVSFDKKLTSAIINTVIEQLDEIGFKVVACVFKCKAEILQLWNELGVDYENVFVRNEKSGEKVFFFADPRDLLESVRKSILSSDLRIDERRVNKKPLVKLINDQNDLDLNSAHVTFEKSDFALARKLISRPTANELRTFYEEDSLARETADFIDLTSYWFDVMSSEPVKSKALRFFMKKNRNSSNKSNPLENSSSKPPNKTISTPSRKKKNAPSNSDSALSAILNKPYGLALEDQNNILEEMYSTILNLRCKNKNDLQLFQQGILLSINSLRELHLEIRANHKIDSVPTAKLQIVELENLFEQIRAGGEEPPTPLEALKRFRLIILGNNNRFDLRAEYDASDDIDEYIVGKVLNCCHIKITESEWHASPTEFFVRDGESVEENFVSVKGGPECDEGNFDSVNVKESLENVVNTEGTVESFVNVGKSVKGNTLETFKDVVNGQESFENVDGEIKNIKREEMETDEEFSEGEIDKNDEGNFKKTEDTSENVEGNFINGDECFENVKGEMEEFSESEDVENIEGNFENNEEESFVNSEESFETVKGTFKNVESAKWNTDEFSESEHFEDAEGNVGNAEESYIENREIEIDEEFSESETAVKDFEGLVENSGENSDNSSEDGVENIEDNSVLKKTKVLKKSKINNKAHFRTLKGLLVKNVNVNIDNVAGHLKIANVEGSYKNSEEISGSPNRVIKKNKIANVEGSYKNSEDISGSPNRVIKKNKFEENCEEEENCRHENTKENCEEEDAADSSEHEYAEENSLHENAKESSKEESAEGEREYAEENSEEESAEDEREDAGENSEEESAENEQQDAEENSGEENNCGLKYAEENCSHENAEDDCKPENARENCGNKHAEDIFEENCNDETVKVNLKELTGNKKTNCENTKTVGVQFRRCNVKVRKKCASAFEIKETIGSDDEESFVSGNSIPIRNIEENFESAFKKKTVEDICESVNVKTKCEQNKNNNCEKMLIYEQIIKHSEVNYYNEENHQSGSGEENIEDIIFINEGCENNFTNYENVDHLVLIVEDANENAKYEILEEKSDETNAINENRENVENLENQKEVNSRIIEISDSESISKDFDSVEISDDEFIEQQFETTKKSTRISKKLNESGSKENSVFTKNSTRIGEISNKSIIRGKSATLKKTTRISEMNKSRNKDNSATLIKSSRISGTCNKCTNSGIANNSIAICKTGDDSIIKQNSVVPQKLSKICKIDYDPTIKQIRNKIIPGGSNIKRKSFGTKNAVCKITFKQNPNFSKHSSNVCKAAKDVNIKEMSAVSSAICNIINNSNIKRNSADARNARTSYKIIDDSIHKQNSACAKNATAIYKIHDISVNQRKSTVQSNACTVHKTAGVSLKKQKYTSTMSKTSDISINPLTPEQL